MKLDASRLSMFGFDLRRLSSFFCAGWRELLWGEAAGIRARLDVPVFLLDEQGEERAFVAEKPVVELNSEGKNSHSAMEEGKPTANRFEAMSLPQESVLFKMLTLPIELEYELDDVLGFEVRSSSPFPVEQTCSGWRLMSRDSGKLQVLVAIVARSDANALLMSRGFSPGHQEELPELWAMFDEETPVVLSGFGEQRHYEAYRKRIGYFAGRIAFLFSLVILLLTVPGLVRSLQSNKVEAYLLSAEEQSREAQALRTELQQFNERAESLQALLDQQANYYQLLAHLSANTPDGVYLQRLDLEGRRVRLNGWADNAGAFMQLMAADNAYQEVRTPSAFSRDSRTGLERFALDMELSDIVRHDGQIND